MKFLDETYSKASTDEKVFPAILGFMFYWAWYFYNFFNPSLFANTAESLFEAQLILRVVGAASAVLGGFILMRIVNSKKKNWLLGNTAKALPLGTLLVSALPISAITVANSLGGIEVPFLLSCLAWVLFGLTLLPFYAVWTSLFSTLESAKSLMLLPLSLAFAVLLCYPVGLIDSQGGDLVSATFPFLSAAIYYYLSKYIIQAKSLPEQLFFENPQQNGDKSINAWLRTHSRRSIVVLLFSCIMVFEIGVLVTIAYECKVVVPVFPIIALGPIALTIYSNLGTQARYLPFSLAQRVFLPLIIIGLLATNLLWSEAGLLFNSLTILATVVLEITCVAVTVFSVKKYDLPSFRYLTSSRLPALIGSLVGWTLLFIYTQLSKQLSEQVVFELISYFFIIALVVTICAAPFLEDRFTTIMERLDLAKGSWKNRCKSISSAYHLTPRESEVLQYLSHGRNAVYIEKQLCISSHTARTHITHIYAKFNINSQQELMDLIENFDVNESPSSNVSPLKPAKPPKPGVPINR